MPRLKRCSYFQCKNTRKNKKMFSFPKKGDTERLKAWIENCGNPDVAELDNKYLCSDHFNEYDLKCEGKFKVLVRCAIPLHYKAPDTPVPHVMIPRKRKNCKRLKCKCSVTKKKVVYLCSYYDCNSTSAVKKLFRFPRKNVKRTREWINNSGNNINIDPERYHNRFLCIDHFEPEHVSVSGSVKILSPFAVPYPYQPSGDQPYTLSVEIDVVEGGTCSAVRPTPRILLRSSKGMLLDDKDSVRFGDIDKEFNPFSAPRDASTEPASTGDIPIPALRVLKCDDRINDRALRAMLPKDSFECNWSDKPIMFKGKREIFSLPEGPNFAIDEDTRPIDVFSNMFDNDFIDLLCLETNQYANGTVACLRETDQLTPDHPLYHWTPTDRSEIFSFLALLILQGLHPLAHDKSYFTSSRSFSKIMPHNRYLMLESVLYSTDALLPENSKSCVVQPMIDYFNQKFLSLYSPAQELVFEEFLLSYNGLLSFSQKIESRIKNDEVKTYEICEAVTGYLLRFYVYDGIEDQHNSMYQMKDSEIDELEVTPMARIVYHLLEPLLNRGHNILLDHFYNSPLLARCLKGQKTDVCGTIRLDRQLVPYCYRDLTSDDLNKDEVRNKYCRDMTVMVWRDDNNLVGMVSTFTPFPENELETNNERVPPLVRCYNRSMKGVERRNKYLYSNPIERHSYGWTKVLFRRLINVALYNCYIMYSGVNTKLSHRQFRVLLVEDLLKLHRCTIDFKIYRKLLRSQIRQSDKDQPIEHQPEISYG